MTYDVDNRLAKVDGNSVTMDADGNLVSGPLTNDTFATYTYDARNRMLNAGGVTNVYDAMNNRIGQTYGTNTTVFIVNPNSKLPEVLMLIKNGVTNYYVYAGGAGLIYQITEAASGTNTLTYHFDYRGSTVALSDNNGNVTDRMEYSLYATMTYRVGTNDTPFLFNGRYGVQSDPNGLLYMRARYYNPFLCRFINPDPSGFSGGLNFYAYANGNPVSFLDPFGLSFWSVTGHFAEGVVIGAAVAVVVVIAAPEIAAGGAAALVWASAGEISAATATTYASATVTVGLATTATYGASQVAGDAVGSAEGGNWDQVAFDAGTLTGGLVVGGGGGGRALAENITGSPSSIKPSWNPFGDMSASYDSDYPNGSLLNWLATAPTPQSGAGVLTLTAGSAASSTLGNWINESTTTVSVNPNPISAPTESGPIQSSSTGK
jgi:RHS repeat-associated protein